MSVSFEVRYSGGAYGVAIERGLFTRILDEETDAVILADAYIAERIAGRGERILPIVADEEAKGLDRISEYVSSIRRMGAGRNTRLLAVGGGVVQDIAGFVASIYMRGMPWSYAPTTLVGMADSCIGGKSSINVGGFKNLVGGFYPPQQVLIDPDFVSTLSTAQRVAGLIEAAKICFCCGADAFDAFLRIGARIEGSVDQFGEVILLSLSQKRDVIELDEFDRKERLLLNYGHTFGHALEAASDYRISHGVGVGLGMLAATSFAFRRGEAEPAGRLSACNQLVRLWLSEIEGLKETVSSLSSARLLQALEADKKHSPDAFALILPTGSIGVQRTLIPRTDASRRDISDAFTALADDIR